MSTPDRILALDALFVRTIELIFATRQALQQINDELAPLAALRSPYDSLKWSVSDVGDVAKEAEQFAKMVQGHAVDEFSTRDEPAEIELQDCLKPWYCKADALIKTYRRDGDHDKYQQGLDALWASFRPSAMWAALAAQFTPERVAADAARTAATALIDAFKLDRQKQVTLVGGRIELPICIYAEKSYQGVRTLSYDCVRRLHRTAGALRTFASQALAEGEQGGAIAGARLLEAVADYNRPITSRERLSSGPASLVTFNDTFKLYLPADLAGPLNVYVTAHAPQRFAGRAA